MFRVDEDLAKPKRLSFSFGARTANITTIKNQTSADVEAGSGMVGASAVTSGNPFRSAEKQSQISNPMFRFAVDNNPNRLKPSGVVTPLVGGRFGLSLMDQVRRGVESKKTLQPPKGIGLRDTFITKSLGETIRTTFLPKTPAEVIEKVKTTLVKYVPTDKETLESRATGSQKTINRDVDVPRISTPIEPVATAVPKGLPSVTFPAFRIPIFVRDRLETLSLSEANGGIKDKTIPVGTYVFTFDIPQVENLQPFAIATAFPFTCSGKAMRLDKALVDPANKIVRMQVTVLENPIPLLILIAAAGAGVGFAGWGLEKTLKQVDRVILSTGQLVLIGAVGLVAWYAVPKMFGARKAA